MNGTGATAQTLPTDTVRGPNSHLLLMIFVQKRRPQPREPPGFSLRSYCHRGEGRETEIQIKVDKTKMQFWNYQTVMSPCMRTPSIIHSCWRPGKSLVM